MYAELMRKTCTKCKIEQDIVEFYKNKRYADGHATWCRTCKKEHARNNPQIYRRWVENNKEASKEIKQRYVENNLEAVKASKSKWAKANNKKVLAKTRKYQAAKLQRTPKWLTSEDIKKMESIYISCPEGYEVDHEIPLQGKNVSGLHVPSNLRILPMKKNRQKSNKY